MRKSAENRCNADTEPVMQVKSIFLKIVWLFYAIRITCTVNWYIC